MRLLARSATVVMATMLVATLMSSSAGAASQIDTSHRFGPGQARVVNSRYASTVKIDGGVVTVRPPAAHLHTWSSEAAVETKAWATENVMGYRAVTFGLGRVTITQNALGVPHVENLLAWVGLVYVNGATFSCPMMRSGSDPVKLPSLSLPSNGYAAVIIGDKPGSPAVVYKARSEACGRVDTSSLANAREAVSVPWIPNGILVSEVMNVQVSVPPCAGIGGVSTGGSATAMTITVYALVPESPVAVSCVPNRVVNQTVTLGPGSTPDAPPPLVSSSTHLLHGDLGPVQVVGPPV